MKRPGEIPSGFDEASLNNACYVALTTAGIRRYDESFKSLGLDPIPMRFTPRGVEFQLWDLMHTFGPQMIPGYPIPFEHNGVAIEFKQEEVQIRAINLNDNILVRITQTGMTMLPSDLRKVSLQRVGEFTQLPFNRVASIFGSRMHNGSLNLPIEIGICLPL